MSTLKDVYSKWQNDPGFRTAFKLDPQKALRDSKLQLSEADLNKAKTLFAGEALDKKISK